MNIRHASTGADDQHQYTRYHGTICYSNAGDDDLRSSGFWTIQIYTGCYSGYLNYYG